MIELPKLSERIVRLHALRWNDLIKAHGFTGEHFQWHQSHEKRHKAAKPRYSLAPPPPTDVSRDRFPQTRDFRGDQGDWRKKQLEAWAARESDPAVIDSIGITETVAVAKARFTGIADDYLGVWADTNGNSDEFTEWLERISHLVESEVGDLWRQRAWHAAWFERACRGAVHDQLATLVDQWKSRASGLEIQHLENPHLSLRSLLVAGGDLNFAVTFEQSEQTIKSGLRLLESLEAIDSTTVGNRPIPTEAIEDGSTQHGTRTAGIDDGGVLPNPGTFVKRGGVGTMNITAQQKDLLIAIVHRHLSSDGKPYMFSWSHSGSGFSSEGPAAPRHITENDFRQLQRERLLTYETVGHNVISGTPTQLGIETAASLRCQSAPSEDPAQRVASSSKGSSEGRMTHLPSWEDLQTEFLKYAVEHADLHAAWTWLYTPDDQVANRPPLGDWSFHGGSPSSQHLFKEIARRADHLLPEDAVGNEPWRRLLNLMLAEGYGRRLRPRQATAHRIRTATIVFVPPEFGNQYVDQQIENVFKLAADFCHVRSLAEQPSGLSSRPAPDAAPPPVAANDSYPGPPDSDSHALEGPGSSNEAELSETKAPAFSRNSNQSAAIPASANKTAAGSDLSEQISNMVQELSKGLDAQQIAALGTLAREAESLSKALAEAYQGEEINLAARAAQEQLQAFCEALKDSEINSNATFDLRSDAVRQALRIARKNGRTIKNAALCLRTLRASSPTPSMVNRRPRRLHRNPILPKRLALGSGHRGVPLICKPVANGWILWPGWLVSWPPSSRNWEGTALPKA